MPRSSNVRSNTRGTRRTQAHGNNLVWTTPVTEESTEGISFAPPITPVTYSNDTPASSSSSPSSTPSNSTFVWPINNSTDAMSATPTSLPTSDSAITLVATSASTASADGTNSLPILSMIPDPSNPAFIRKWKAKAQSHAKKHEPGHIPRPPNAFMLFRSAFVACNAITNKTERNSATLSQIIGHTWKGMTVSERKEWYAKAHIVFDKHMIKFPEYNFRPDHPPKGTKKPKRKMKEVEVKDAERCAQVAQAVLEGKSGEELEKIMEEWDRTHAKKTNIRFDPLLTAETFEKQQAEKEKEKEKQKQKEEPQFLVEHPEEPRKKRTAIKKKAATPTLSIPDSPASLESPVSPLDGYYSQNSPIEPSSAVSTQSFQWSENASTISSPLDSQGPGTPLEAYPSYFDPTPQHAGYDPIEQNNWDMSQSQYPQDQCSSGYLDDQGFPIPLPPPPMPVDIDMTFPHVPQHQQHQGYDVHSLYANQGQDPSMQYNQSANSYNPYSDMPPLVPHMPVMPTSMPMDMGYDIYPPTQLFPDGSYTDVSDMNMHGPFAGLKPQAPCAWQMSLLDLELRAFSAGTEI